MTNTEKAQVMLAADAGANIQRKAREGEWEADSNPTWNWEEYRYRVADNLGYFIIRTDAKPHKVFDTKRAAERAMSEWHKHTDARIVECVEKPI